jgi:hypothetical protein|tara:strand:- start:426 stop:548 length:123 start_codon:yes stop_codon:yes gene_type:complete
MVEIFLLPVIILKYLIAAGFWIFIGYLLYDFIRTLRERFL